MDDTALGLTLLALFPILTCYAVALLYRHGEHVVYGCARINAPLIAASPEMLETLKEIQNVLMRAEVWPSDVSYVRILAGDAIAKAEGRS